MLLTIILLQLIGGRAIHAQWVQVNAMGYNTTCFAVSGTKLFAGTADDGVWLTTDFGVSWSSVSIGLASMHIQCLAFLGTKVFAGTMDGGMFFSTNDGANWTPANGNVTDFNVTALSINGTSVFAGTQTGGVFLSTNSGTGWVAVTNGMSNLSIRSLLASATKEYAGTCGGGIFTSTNKGTNWVAFNSGLSSPYPYVYAMALIGTSVFAGTDGAGVFVSKNNGSWSAVNTGFNTNPVVLSFAASSTYLFAGTLGDDIYVTPNSGTNWTNCGWNGNAAVQALAVCGSFLFAGDAYSGVWRRPLSELTPIELTTFTATAYDHSVDVAWTTASETNNAGFELERRFAEDPHSETTRTESTEPWIHIADIPGVGTSTTTHSYRHRDSGLASGWYDYRLKQIDTDGSFRYYHPVNVSVGSPFISGIGAIFPNPFVNETAIIFFLSKSGFASMKIYSPLGEEIAVIVSEELSAGSHVRTWHAKNLRSGTYLCRFHAGDHPVTKRLTVLK